MARGRISAEQLQRARTEQQRTGQPLGAVLVQSGFLTEPVLRQLERELQGHSTLPPPVRQPASAPPASRPPEPVAAAPVVLEQAPVTVAEPAENKAAKEPEEPAIVTANDVIDVMFGGDAALKPGELPGLQTTAPEEAFDPESLLRPLPPEEDDDVEWADFGEAEKTPLMRTAPPAVPLVTEVTPVSLSRAKRFALRSQVDLLLAAAEKEGASDLHLHANQPVMMRVNGRLLTADAPPLQKDELESWLLATFDDDAAAAYQKTQDVDYAYVTTGGLRTRANVFRQQGGVDGVFRLVPRQIRTLAELGMPEDIARFTDYHAGLVLVTGPAGCGKSTTLNALVDLINQTRDDHVLTVEDPVEFVHESKSCLVNQRQVKRHTESFARALRAALREDPDIIVIGELRDYETISLAITAAETGHLVLGSLHTNGAARTIARLLDVFPPNQQSQVRSMISESLRGVVSQKLIPTVDGTRVPAVEVLSVTHAISNLIREDKMHQVRSAMQVGRAQGMRLLDDSIRELLQAGRVAKDVARRYMDSPASLEPPSSQSGPATNPPVAMSTPPSIPPRTGPSSQPNLAPVSTPASKPGASTQSSPPPVKRFGK